MCRDIVYLSTNYWDGQEFLKQEFMPDLSRENRVRIVEPSFSIVRKSDEHRKGIATNAFSGSRLEGRNDLLFLFKPPRGLSKSNHPAVNKLNYEWYGRLIGRAMRRQGSRDVIIWLYRPAFRYGLGSIPHRHVAFDLAGDVAAYRRERVSDNASLLNVYEYVATGKPAVATEIETLRREPIGRVIQFTDGAGDFYRHIESCLEDYSAQDVRVREEVVK
jgi:hypothetical protein